MSLEFKFKQSAEQVFDLFCDPDFLVERSIALGELSADAEVDEDDSGKVIITMTRKVTRELPSFLAKLFKPEQILKVREEWQQIGSNFIGKGVFTVEGQPVEVKSDFTLKSNDDGCTFTVKYKPKASIPLIGGKVEKYIESNCLDGGKKELDFAAKKLAG